MSQRLGDERAERAARAAQSLGRGLDLGALGVGELVLDRHVREAAVVGVAVVERPPSSNRGNLRMP